MKISTSNGMFSDAKGLLAIPVSVSDIKPSSDILKRLSDEFGFSIAKELKQRGYEAKDSKNCQIDTPQHNRVKALLFCSTSSSSDKNISEAENYRRLGAMIAESAREISVDTISVIGSQLNLKTDSNLSAVIEGIGLSQYSFSKYKRSNKKTAIKQIVFTNTKKNLSSSVRNRAKALVSGTELARDLVNTPAKDCRPRDLVACARKICKDTSIKLQVFDKKQLKKLGAGALLSVSEGSDEPPYLIKMTYKPKSKPKKSIALVGKGVTFDSGGLSMKPAEGMISMKCDMGGAAAVLGAMQSVAMLKPNVAVTAYVPTTENMINGKASKPGDVVKAVNGKTIEVLNTDAEGRLILADALCLASKEKFDAIIDLATLTGSVSVALGDEYAGLFTDSENLADKLIRAGEIAGEKFWRLPLAPEYEEYIASEIADVKNVGKGRLGGSITAALFLKNFVTNLNWAHLDIAGTAYRKSATDYRPSGGVGFGVRTIVNYILGL